VSAGSGGHRRRVMAADVEEGAQLAVSSAHGENRLARKLGGKVIAWMSDLVGSSNRLPVPGKDMLLFQPLNAGSRYQGAGIVCASSSGAASS
jgi:hypothetical protein